MSEKTEKLSKILKDVEGGYISADHAEANILDLFESATPSPALQDAVMGFSRAEIEQLQNRVHAITGNGDVMVLFNQLLGNSAA